MSGNSGVLLFFGGGGVRVCFLCQCRLQMEKRKMRKKGGFTIQLDAENRQRLRQTAADDR